MKDEIFFDANILTYFLDEAETTKKNVCAELVQKVFKGEIVGYISNQILAELYTNLTKHLRKPLSKELASSIVESFIISEKWKKINYTEKTVQAALDILEGVEGSIWDVIIVQTMKENNLIKIFTEDKFFHNISGIEAINPFK